MNWLVILFVGVPVAFVAGVMLRKALEDIGEEYRDVREAAWAEVVKELERNSAAAKLSFEDGCVPKCNLGTRVKGKIWFLRSRLDHLMEMLSKTRVSWPSSLGSSEER